MANLEVKQKVGVEVVRAGKPKQEQLEEPIICKNCGNLRSWVVRCEHCGE
jgi:hypothetical protein